MAAPSYLSSEELKVQSKKEHQNISNPPRHQHDCNSLQIGAGLIQLFGVVACTVSSAFPARKKV